jgi:hypothetical protein
MAGLNPEDEASPATVQVYALSGGHFSLPEENFVRPHSEGVRTTVPSLCFLIQHTSRSTSKTTRIVFDLGLRRDVTRYSEPIQRHIGTRQPMTTTPDVVESLELGGLKPRDIDYVIYSHVSRTFCLVHKRRELTWLTGPLGSCR